METPEQRKRKEKEKERSGKGKEIKVNKVQTTDLQEDLSILSCLQVLPPKLALHQSSQHDSCHRCLSRDHASSQLLLPCFHWLLPQGPSSLADHREQQRVKQVQKGQEQRLKKMMKMQLHQQEMMLHFHHDPAHFS